MMTNEITTALKNEIVKGNKKLRIAMYAMYNSGDKKTPEEINKYIALMRDRGEAEVRELTRLEQQRADDFVDGCNIAMHNAMIPHATVIVSSEDWIQEYGRQIKDHKDAISDIRKSYQTEIDAFAKAQIESGTRKAIEIRKRIRDETLQTIKERWRIDL